MIEVLQALEHLAGVHFRLFLQCNQGPVDPAYDTVRSLLPLAQQLPLGDQRAAAVVRRGVEHLFDGLQAEAQFPQQPDLAQPFQVVVVVEAVAVLRPPRRRQQAEPVVVVQGAHGDTSQCGDLADGVEVGGGGGGRGEWVGWSWGAR